MAVIKYFPIIILLCTFININDIVIPIGNTIVNPLLIISYIIGGGIITLQYFKKGLYKYELNLILILLWMYIATSLRSTFSLNSFIYSGIFITGTIACVRGIKESNFYIKYYNTIKYLIIAFALILIYQQISVTIGLPQFNKCPIYFNNPYKLNSLSFEPSHTARYMLILMVAYIEFKEIINYKSYNSKKNRKEDLLIWFSFIYVMITIGSTSAILFLLLLSLRFLKSKYLFRILLFTIILTYTIFTIADDVESVKRALNVISSLVQSDTTNLATTDSSSSTRILPMFEYFKNIDLGKLEFWIGTGNEWIIKVATSKSDSYTINGAGFFGYLNKYGIISGILYVFFLLKYCYCSNRVDFITIFLSAIYSGFNSPMSWAAIIIMLINNNLKNKINYGNNKRIHLQCFDKNI